MILERLIYLLLLALVAIAMAAYRLAEWAYREVRAYALDDSSHLDA